MNVVPFRPPGPQPAPLAFTIGARVDLRVGALCAGVVRPRAAPDTAFIFSNLSRLLRAARMTWLERGAPSAALTLAIPSEAPAMEADLLSEAAIEAGCTRRGFSFEVCELQMVAQGPSLAEDLRARGWAVVLRGDAACPLPFGARARALYNEVVFDAPEAPDPFLGLEGGDRSPLGRRLLAAKGAGLLITAAHVQSAAQARLLAMAGFDRGGGPFAEKTFR